MIRRKFLAVLLVLAMVLSTPPAYAWFKKAVKKSCSVTFTVCGCALLLPVAGLMLVGAGIGGGGYVVVTSVNRALPEPSARKEKEGEK